MTTKSFAQILNEQIPRFASKLPNKGTVWTIEEIVRATKQLLDQELPLLLAEEEHFCSYMGAKNVIEKLKEKLVYK